jgi:hypothetical protein
VCEEKDFYGEEIFIPRAPQMPKNHVNVSGSYIGQKSIVDLHFVPGTLA